MKYYFAIDDDGTATVLCIDERGNYSTHLSTDETVGDGDGAFGPYSWENAQRWTETTREHASTMMRFDFEDDSENR